MAISPITDIVLEVARAADPASYRAATARLRGIGSSGSPEQFDEISRATRVARTTPQAPFDAAGTIVQLKNVEALSTRPSSQYERFEAFVLQTFVQTMLPEGDSPLFGSGTAGEIWKSMLAESLGAGLARAGGIGIAAMLTNAADISEASLGGTHHDHS